MAGEDAFEVNLCVPLTSKREAQICYDVLRVDSEPPRSKVTKTLHCDKNKLYVNISSADLRQLRVSLTSFMEHLQLAIQTLHEFGPPVSDLYSFNKGSESV